MLTREGSYECVRCVVGLHLLLVERLSSCRPINDSLRRMEKMCWMLAGCNPLTHVC